MADDPKLTAMVQQMIDARAPDADIDAAIHLYKEEQNPTLSELKGVMEGLLPGAWGAIRGAFYDLPKGVIDDTLSILNGESPEYAKSVVESLARLPEDFRNASHEERGKIIGNILGGAGIVALAPRTIKPSARKTGELLETVGKKGGWPIRMMGAHQLGSGNPVGAAILAVPEMLQKAGTALQTFGGRETSTRLPSGARSIDVGRIDKLKTIPFKLGPSTGEAANQVPLTGTPAEASGRVQKVMAKEAATASRPGRMTIDEQIADAQTQADIRASDLVAKKAADIEKAAGIAAQRIAAGVEAQPPHFRTSQRGTTAAGVEESVSTTYAKPKQSDLSAFEQEMLDRANKLAPRPAGTSRTVPDAKFQETLERQKALGLTIQSKPATGLAPQPGPARPPIQVDPESVTALSSLPLQGSVRLGRPAQEPVPPSKTRRSPLSVVNPELTVEEEAAFGLPHGTRINKLAPDVKAKLLARRAERDKL